MSRTIKLAGATLLALAAGAPGFAQAVPVLAAALPPGVLSLSTEGSVARATLGVGELELDLSLTFERVIGLNAQNLGLSARLVHPSELLGRLPTQVALPLAFPLLVTIEPPATGGLTFTGVAVIDLHTHNLNFTPNTPLRLFKAPLGGAFVDITESMGMGSYRVRGSTGGFSELLILADTRPTASVVNDKFARLAALLDEHAATMPEPLAEQLGGHLDAAHLAWLAGNELQAIGEINAFSEVVRAASGTSIPDVWRSSRDLTNVAGELRAAATTLRFSLSLAAG